MTYNRLDPIHEQDFATALDWEAWISIPGNIERMNAECLNIQAALRADLAVKPLHGCVFKVEEYNFSLGEGRPYCILETQEGVRYMMDRPNADQFLRGDRAW